MSVYHSRTQSKSLPLFALKFLSLSLASLPVLAVSGEVDSIPQSPSADATGKPAIEEMVVLGQKSNYLVITENAQKNIDVPGSFGDTLMAVFSLPGINQ